MITLNKATVVDAANAYHMHGFAIATAGDIIVGDAFYLLVEITHATLLNIGEEMLAAVWQAEGHKDGHYLVTENAGGAKSIRFIPVNRVDFTIDNLPE